MCAALILHQRIILQQMEIAIKILTGQNIDNKWQGCTDPTTIPTIKFVELNLREYHRRNEKNCKSRQRTMMMLFDK